MTASAAELDADFDTFFRLHDERWDERGGSSSATPRSRRLIQRSFAAAALERGWLRLWIAEADGEPPAAWYGWRIGERYCYSLSGSRRSTSARALGTVLLAHTIEQAAAEGARIYDMMWGDEGYKKRFETGRREVDDLVPRRRRADDRDAERGGRRRRALESLPPWMRRPLRGMRKALHFL